MKKVVSGAFALVKEFRRPAIALNLVYYGLVVLLLALAAIYEALEVILVVRLMGA
jgi:hypothetical protein